MPTGIFFHYQKGIRLKDFPQALNGILNRDNVFFYDAFYPFKPKTSFDPEEISSDTLTKVHSMEMIERVKRAGVFEGALCSASGTLSAAVRICSNDITNAFVFTGYGDHHAGSDFFGGGCYFNSAAIAIRHIEDHFGIKRIALIDTDAHHGDGTWELWENHDNVLTICFCSLNHQETNNNINIRLPGRIDDDGYLELLKDVLHNKVEPFKPEIIFWNWGYDGTIGEYVDMGLSPDFHTRLAVEIKKNADDLCGGRLIVVLCGGSRRDLARLLIPNIIKVLAGISPDG